MTATPTLPGDYTTGSGHRFVGAGDLWSVFSPETTDHEIGYVRLYDPPANHSRTLGFIDDNEQLKRVVLYLVPDQEFSHGPDEFQPEKPAPFAELVLDLYNELDIMERLGDKLKDHFAEKAEAAAHLRAKYAGPAGRW